MRSRREDMASSTPFKGDCMGKIIIRNIRMRIVNEDNLKTWLGKYGTIEDIKLYSTCAVVKFSSDLQAAGAVQCENGIRRFGSNVSIKHAEPDLLWSVEQAENRGRAMEDVNPPTYNRRYDDGPPKRGGTTTRSPPRSRPNRGEMNSGRDSHPLTWLSEAADQSGMKQMAVGGLCGDATSADRLLESMERTVGVVSVGSSGPGLNGGTVTNSVGGKHRPYDVAILAIRHDQVPYAELVQERISTSIPPTAANLPSPTSHIMVLVSLDHLVPCVQDLTNDGVLFAIIVNASNWAHSSCTLRILHSATQQEHRNMPLGEAIDLMVKDYVIVTSSPEPAAALKLQPPASIDSQGVVESGSIAKPESDDPTFLAPTRHVATLLKMLADSRVLSVGELDEIIAFIGERRSRLTNQLAGGASNMGVASNASNAVLKSRILDMLYPNLKTPTQQIQPSPVAATVPGERPLPVGTNPPQQDLVSKLKNPSVQQALDNLIKTSSSTPMPRPAQQQQHGSWHPQQTPPPYMGRGGSRGGGGFGNFGGNYDRRSTDYNHQSEETDEYSHYYMDNEESGCGGRGRAYRRGGESMPGPGGYKRPRGGGYSGRQQDDQEWRKCKRKSSSPIPGKGNESNSSSSSRFVLPSQIMSGGGKPQGDHMSPSVNLMDQQQYSPSKALMSGNLGPGPRYQGGVAVGPQQQSMGQNYPTDNYNQQQSSGGWYGYGSGYEKY